MKNPTGNKLEKLVFRIFDQMVEGADKYVTKHGSTWLIFTESKKWVIEFTKDKTLWFNYNIFQNELDLIGKDCTEERDLIKNWFESRFLNKPKVWATFNHAIDSNQAVEDTIQNGVKEAHHVDVMKFFDKKMENTIENGVKNTIFGVEEDETDVEDTIQNGVKYTIDEKSTFRYVVEDTIQNGVKETRTFNSPPIKSIEDTIENGVKRTFDMEFRNQLSVEDTIENGVKDTVLAKTDRLVGIEDTIQNGVKETQTRMWPPVGAVDETIENGVKDETIQGWDFKIKCEDTIENGVKETKTPGEDGDLLGFLDFMSDNNTDSVPQLIEDTIENGVKEVRTPGVGDLESTVDFMNENNTLDVQKILDDVIENGVKDVKSDEGYMNHFKQQHRAEQTIEDSVKEAKEDRLFRTIHVMNAIVNGVKHAQPMDEWVNSENIVSDVINDGVKYVGNSRIVGETLLKGVIENGVKETKESMLESWEQIDHQVTNSEITENINDAIENGVKEMQPLPAQDGNRDWGLYYHRQEDRTKPHTEYVKEVIEDSYNHRGRIEGVIRNTNKDGI